MQNFRKVTWAEREKRNNAVNSEHLVPGHHMQAAQTKTPADAEAD